MSILEAIIEGILQGATEFLPVSSSGHLSISKHFLGITVDSLLFDVMLHLGTLIAVFAVYYDVVLRLIKALFRFVKDVCTKNFKWKEMDEDVRLLLMLFFGLIPLFLLFVPIPGTDMKIKDLADIWATDNDILIEGCALIITSILLTLGIYAGKKYKTPRDSFKLKDALTVGMVQCCAAIIPGISRSGSTLSSGMMCGLSRKTALDYSFVLGIPSIMAAAVLTIKDAVAESASVEWLPIIVGAVTACIVGFIAIKLLRWMVSTNKIHVFVWYTLILGVICVVISIIERATGVNVITGAPIVF